MERDRLTQQIQFIIEIDKLKRIIRQSYLMDTARRENSAEHSWHLAMMVMVLVEHANESVDLVRVLKMVVIHDIVEIDAGDVDYFDKTSAQSKPQREQMAADRLFGMLPADQSYELREIWQEFEARQTAEARFATALDRLIPLLHNYHTQGQSWHERGITGDRVLLLCDAIAPGSVALSELARTLINDAMNRGYLAPPSDRA